MYNKKLFYIFASQPEISFNNTKEEMVSQVLGRPSMKAVIVDFDFTCNWSKLALGISCLQREDVLYISGAMDEWIPIRSGNSTSRLLGLYPWCHDKVIDK